MAKLLSLDDKQGVDVNDVTNDSSDDEYANTLKHHDSCRIKTRQLIKYRMIERNGNGTKGKKYLQQLKQFIKNSHIIPSADPISLAVDRETGRAVIWDGNHRLSCVQNLKDGEYPEFVKVNIFQRNLDGESGCSGEKLHDVPFLRGEWPTFICGCHLGFDTSDETEENL